MLSNQLRRDIATMESFCHSTPAMEVFTRIKTALEELGTTPNTQIMPVCPNCKGETTVRPLGNGQYKCFACSDIWTGKPA